MLWENLHEDEFARAREEAGSVCLLPVGCMEKHGQHLPLGTDAMWAGELCRLAAEIEPAVVFPTMYFGEKNGAGEVAGTIMFSAKLRFEILSESCREIGRNGFKKILLVSGHGGNANMLANFARSVLEQKENYMVFTCYPGLPKADDLLLGNFDYLTEEDREILKSFKDSGKPTGHGCFFETAWHYHLHPELVRLNKMKEDNGISTGRFEEFTKLGIYTPFGWMANYPNSFTGAYHEGMNERIARAAVDVCVGRLLKMVTFLKNETTSNEYQKEWLDKQHPHI